MQAGALRSLVQLCIGPEGPLADLEASEADKEEAEEAARLIAKRVSGQRVQWKSRGSRHVDCKEGGEISGIEGGELGVMIQLGWDNTALVAERGFENDLNITRPMTSCNA
eukprot:1150009-Pelagomonas_calceolata.AAC.2